MLVASLAARVAPAASADPVADRREEMKEFRDDMRAMKAALDRGNGLDATAELATDMAEDAFEIRDWFAKRTIGPRSRALPAVWDQPAEFDSRIQELSRLAGLLAAAAGQGDLDAATAAFAALGREGCTGCHDRFRRPMD